MSKFCGQCGHRAIGAFCGQCGSRIGGVSKSSVEQVHMPATQPMGTLTEPAVRDAVEQPEEDNPRETGLAGPGVVEETPRSRRLQKPLLISTVLLVALVAGGYFLATQQTLPWSSATTVTKTPNSGSGQSLPDVAESTPPADAAPSSTPERPGTASTTGFDPVQLGLCPDACVESGSVDFQHPAWGTVTLRTFAPESPPGMAGAAVLSESGEVLWYLQAAQENDHQYEWSLAAPAIDSSGLLFINYNPGRYNGLAILRPTADGMDIVAWPYDAPGGQVLYNAELEGPGEDGKYVIIQYRNDCTPSCADGTTTTEQLTWNGSEFAASQPRSTDEVGRVSVP